jgi:hypothetical protein
LAQVLWAKEAKHFGDGIIGLDKLVSVRRDAYEAWFKIILRRGDIQEALKACMNWANDEPFAVRPKLETTFVASLLDDHELTIRIVQEAQRIDGKLSHSLELNLLFAQLSSGQINPRDSDIAIRIITRLKALIALGGPVSVHATANLALLNYRGGNADVGRDLYRMAIDTARKNDGLESAAMAATFAAREAILVATPDAEAQLKQAVDLAERSGSEYSSFYNRKLQALIAAPERAGLILSPSSVSEFMRPVKILKISKDKVGFILTVGRS